jgi:flagellar biosynthesis/type III secretory pathway M-ring protein FliF/YscJ
MQYYDLTVFVIKSLFVIIIVLSLLIVVIWPLLRNLRHRSERRSIESPVQIRQHPVPMFPVDEEEVEIPTTGKSDADQNKEIVKIALDDPSKTTHLIRNWINEKK